MNNVQILNSCENEKMISLDPNIFFKNYNYIFILKRFPTHTSSFYSNDFVDL
jgi:hypothetical protein